MTDARHSRPLSHQPNKLPNTRPALLVLYHLRGAVQIPLRKSVEDHLMCWGRYSRFPVIYHNYAFGFDWAAYEDIPIAAIIFDTLALNIRWTPNHFRARTNSLSSLRAYRGLKIAMPQDEFIHTDVLCDFFQETGVTHILSAGTPAVARQIYGDALERVTLGSKLTGYLDSETLHKVEGITNQTAKRRIDISYRAWRAEAWLGRHGLLKAQIADEANKLVSSFPDLNIDVSTRDDSTIVGDDWYRFLAQSVCTLGVEGGASIIDRDGSIAARTRAFVAENPLASFDEIERACFPGQDGGLELFAIGPRHLEACATRTCQLLVEGHYQGILQPGDYIPIKRDFSNLKDIFELVRRKDPAIEAASNAAYDRVVGSNRYTYQGFVKSIEDNIIVPRLKWQLLFGISREQARRIQTAIERNAKIAAFAEREALKYCRELFAYQYGEDPYWRQEREAAQRLANETGIILDPNWG